MTKVPVLVTGGAGYIGSHAVLALRDAGWPVAVIDDLSTGTREVVPEDVPFYEGVDRRPRAGRADHRRAGHRRDHAFRGLDRGSRNRSKSRSIIMPTTRSPATPLIAAAVAGGVRHFLFSSTAAVYGAPERVPIEEDDPQAADQPLWRVQADDRADARRLRRRRIRSTMARCAISTSPGADPDGRAGQIGKGSTHLIKVAVEAAVGKRDHVAVFGTDYPTPDGTCVRDYIHVSDLAAAHVARSSG